MKKVSKVDQVKNILKTNATATAKEVAKVMGIKEAYAGTLLWKAKGGKQKKLTPVNKTKRKYTKRDRHEYVNGAQVLISKDVEKLQAEVFKLNDWCIQWSSKVKETEARAEAKYAEEISRLKYMICDKDAVIDYLEEKIVQLVAKAQ